MKFRLARICCLAVLLMGSIAMLGVAQHAALYTSVPTEIITQIVDAFEVANPGITIDVFRSGTGTVTAKIAAEMEAGGVQADLVWVADFAYYETLKQEGLLLQYDPPAAGDIPANLKDSDGYYYGARMISVVIAYNTIQVDTPPRRWKDLLDEKWNGLIAMANPLYSGAALDAFGAIAMNYGLEYYQALRANGADVIRGNSGTAGKVASGEFLVGITLDYIVRNMKAEGSPIDVIYPIDGAVAIPSPIGIISSSENIEAAKAFVDFAVSREGQETLRELGNFIPVIPGMEAPEGAPTLEELAASAMEIDWAYIGRNTDWLRDQFTTIMLE